MALKFNDDGYPYEDLTTENKKLESRIKELDNSLAIALDINDKYQRENKDLKDKIKESGEINKLHQELNKKLKKRAQEAEGEVTIVKGIGMNSPEMRALQKQKEILKAACKKAGARIKELEEDREVLPIPLTIVSSPSASCALFFSFSFSSCKFLFSL